MTPHTLGWIYGSCAATTGSLVATWAMEDCPAMNEEPFLLLMAPLIVSFIVMLIFEVIWTDNTKRGKD